MPILPFPLRRTASRPLPAYRTLGNKMQHLAFVAPDKLRDVERLIDWLLDQYEALGWRAPDRTDHSA